MRKNKFGFTLPQLLIVIAIIGILSSMSWVSYQGLQPKARDAHRKIDLRNLSQAVEMYSNDHPDEGYPLVAGDCISISDLEERGIKLREAISPYLPEIPLDPIYGGDPLNDYFYCNYDEKFYGWFARLENEKDSHYSSYYLSYEGMSYAFNYLEKECNPPCREFETTLTYLGATTAQYSDTLELKAKLTKKVGKKDTPLDEKEIEFTLGEQKAKVLTDEEGIALTSLILNQKSGSYIISAVFKGVGPFLSSSDSDPFEILKEDTALTYTGDTSDKQDEKVTLSAQLSETDESIGNLEGKTITFTLGSQSVNGVTDNKGKTKTELVLSQPPGDYILKTDFLGDDYYLSSFDEEVFGILPKEEGGIPGIEGCFIATAAYGSPLEPEIQVLREFRDEYLLTNSFGQWFVEEYYKYSPPLADLIAQNEFLKEITKLGLKPLIEISRIFINE